MELLLLLMWAVAYVALLVWTMQRRRRIIGGAMLILLSLFPMSYGRWITPSEWHDYPLMAIYYLPTIIALLVSLIIVTIGLVIKARQALLNRRGA